MKSYRRSAAEPPIVTLEPIDGQPQSSEPRYMHMINSRNEKIIYEKHLPRQEVMNTIQLVNLAYAAAATAYAFVRVRQIHAQGQVARHMAKVWECRCMKLKGRPTPSPPTPNAFEQFWYGSRGRFWAEHYDSPWEKMLKEHKQRQDSPTSTKEGSRQ